jgi:hypothetical protein
MTWKPSVWAPARSLDQIEDRVRSVLRTYSKGELASLLPRLTELGEVGVLGGLLRDMAMNVPSTFTSDVDIVVAPRFERSLDRLMQSLGCTVNRFGGYRLHFRRGSADIWPLSRTWAFVHRFRTGSRLYDLIGTTYFSWDSIVYSVQRGRVFCRPSYLHDLRLREVDLELEENPNPMGSLVRTLRLVAKGMAGLKPRLANHTWALLGTTTLTSVLKYELEHYSRAILDKDNSNSLIDSLERHVAETPDITFSLPQTSQTGLPLPALGIAEALLEPTEQHLGS